MLSELLHTKADLYGIHGFLHLKTYNWTYMDPVRPEHVDNKDWGMSPPLYAFVFCVVSGLSLPIGAALGIIFSPVSDKTCSMMMSFGAGALLFAVTVEMYGHSLTEVMAGRSGLYEMGCTIGGALVGCASYIVMNKKLEQHLMKEEGFEEDAEENIGQLVAEHLRKEEDALRGRRDSGPSALLGKQITKAKPKFKSSSSMPDLDVILDEDGLEHKVTFLQDHPLVRARAGALRALHVKEVDKEEAEHARSVALALFLGLFLDGVPEGILMGFLAAEHHLTPVLIVSLFIANFPEAFSSASLLIQAEMPIWKIIGMWTGLCLLVGVLGFGSCWCLTAAIPEFGTHGFKSDTLPVSVLAGIALVEGITGGSMLACISGVMLPEAFERCGKTGPFYMQSGFMCVSGFLMSVTLKTLFG